MPLREPSTPTVPMTLLAVSASSSSSATRTKTMTGRVMAAMARSERTSVHDAGLADGGLGIRDQHRRIEREDICVGVGRGGDEAYDRGTDHCQRARRSTLR
ncbi:hypothetical protein [Sphingomonas sp. VDB2]|uniref:hypothetical protein n=1 Tax=Sphingomonas sp. VDB2 TaxID=3228751 RepID=UPI003A8010A0